MMQGKTIWLLVSLMLATAIASCGGGGGGGGGDAASNSQEPTVNVSISPASIKYSFPGNQALNPATATASVSWTTTNRSPSDGFYLVLSASGPILSPNNRNPVSFQWDDSFNAKAYISLDRDLPVGTHTGNFYLSVYRDSAHTSPYRVIGGVVPYTITVTPGISLTAKVNGTSVPPGELHVTDGDIVEIQSSVPVHWSYATGGAHPDGVTTTATTWTGAVRYSVSTHGDTGQMIVEATTFASPETDQAHIYAWIFVTE